MKFDFFLSVVASWFLLFVYFDAIFTQEWKKRRKFCHLHAKPICAQLIINSCRSQSNLYTIEEEQNVGTSLSLEKRDQSQTDDVKTKKTNWIAYQNAVEQKKNFQSPI